MYHEHNFCYKDTLLCINLMLESTTYFHNLPYCLMKQSLKPSWNLETARLVPASLNIQLTNFTNHMNPLRVTYAVFYIENSQVKA
jgi:hypothetical protein